MGVRGISGDDARLMVPGAEGQLAARQPQPPNAARAGSRLSTDKVQEERPEASPKMDDVEHMARLLNGILESLNWNIRLRIDDSHDMIVAQIIDPAKDEIIKQIPPQELLDIMSHLQELVGLLLDREA
jgi:uncharacterized FlaG/YvyC family protein